MCYRPAQAEVEAAKNAPAKTRECPKCGAVNKLTNKVCESCGEKLPPMKLQRPAGPSGPKAPNAPRVPGAPPASPSKPKGPSA